MKKIATILGAGPRSYEVEVNSDWHFVSVNARSRTQAAARVRAAGFEARSVNFTG